MNQNQLIEWSKGNPGAMMFLLGLFRGEGLLSAIPIITKLEECTSIRGTNLYVLFSDLCNKDYEMCARLCESNEILENACSRQDYSGRALVKKYL
jgi:hypothetical protein